MRRLPVVRWPALASAGILAVMILPYWQAAVKTEWANYRRGIEVIVRGVPPERALLLSGVYFPRDPRRAGDRREGRFHPADRQGRAGDLLHGRFLPGAQIVRRLAVDSHGRGLLGIGDSPPI